MYCFFIITHFGSSRQRRAVRFMGETMKKIRVLSLLLIVILVSSLFSTTAVADDDSDFSVDAESAILLDLDTGTILYEQNSDETIYPSSLTKIVTAMLILEYGNLDETATVSATAISEVGDQASTLQEGEVLTLDSLLYMIMVSSVNEACNVAAEHIAGSIDAFVEMMNEKASSLGCTGTHFTNTHGLHDDDHYSTALDLSILAMAAIETDGFMTYAGTEQITLPATNLAGQRTLVTGNYLISTLETDDYYYEAAEGIKSGHTTAGGYCVISTAEQSDMHLLGIICGAEAVADSDGNYIYKNFTECRELFEYGFSNFEVQTVLNTTDIIATVPALLSAGDQTLELTAAAEISALMPLGYAEEDLTYEITLYNPDGVEAPTAIGAKLGTVTVSYGNRVLGTTTLISSNATTRSEFAYKMQQLKTALSNIYIKFVIAVLIAVVLLFFLHEFAAVPRRRYYKMKKKLEKKQKRQTSALKSTPNETGTDKGTQTQGE